MNYEIRAMTARDLDRALGWARDEGWNPGIEDAEAFYAADPTGFLMGFVDGTPASSISVVKYGEHLAFLGLYIVSPEHRGKGLGKAIWDAGISSAANRTIALDGVVAQQENYRKSGFVLAHRSARWGGRVTGNLDSHHLVRAVRDTDLGSILAYDRGVFHAPRDDFLRLWTAASPRRRSLGYFEADDVVRGYTTIRRAAEGWKVGPLFADTAEIAEVLMLSVARQADPDPVFVDIPEPNAAGQALAIRLGLSPSFETARMYRGPRPNLPLPRIFGITSLELG